METKSNETFTLSKLFPTLANEELKLIQEHSSLLQLKKGQNLFRLGDEPTSVFGIVQGCFKILRESQEGENVITSLAAPGQILGAREVFRELNYSRSAIALKKTEVFCIEKNIFFSLVSKNPDLSIHFLKIFCAEIENLEQRLESNLHVPAKNRIGGILYELYQLFAEKGAQTFEPPLSRRELAELADVTPETVSRSLTDFKKAGLLKTQGAAFTIFDINAFKNDHE